MKLSVYNDVLNIMQEYNTRECFRLIQEKYPDLSINTLGSIFSQNYQKKMKKTHHIHYNPEKMNEYFQRYNSTIKKREKHVLLRLADEIDLSPALLARIILERYLSQTEYAGETAPKPRVTQMMRDPSLITNSVLSTEVQECILSDDHYGPIVDSIKHGIGQEYEFKLTKKLDTLGYAYLHEDHMRARGYDKTPDVKLEVPISVDGYIVNWIESKASFGDEFSNRNYLKDQFWSYWNRFGPGMVIYWFGFIEELDVHRDKGIILRDSFPDNIVCLNPMAKVK